MMRINFTDLLNSINLIVSSITNASILIKSFNFSNEVDRLTSGFKLKKLSIKAEHNLHDWTLKSEFSFSPRLKTDKKPYYYDYSPYFSLSVVWNPMKSLKTQIVDDYGTFQLNP